MYSGVVSLSIPGEWSRLNSRAFHSVWASTVQDDAHDTSSQETLDAEEKSAVDAARRDRAAFAPLYRKYVTPLYRYFYQQVSRVEDAEDLTATTFHKALAGLERYETRGSFAAWLFGIARNTLYDYRRARYGVGGIGDHVDVEVVAPLLVDPTPGPEAQVLQSEQADILRVWVARLPDEQREALVLRIFGELSVRDIASILGKSEGAVKMLVHRAVETLRVYSAGEQER